VSGTGGESFAASPKGGIHRRHLLYYPSLALHYLAMEVKCRLAYRADFWAGLISDLFHHASTLVVLLVLFSHIPHIKGWNREEMLFIYGYFLLPFSLFLTTSANYWEFSDRYVVKGELDRLLIRPLPVLFQLMLEEIELEAFFGFPVGVALMAYSASRLGLAWGALDFLALGILVLAGTLLYHGVFLLLASLAFWAEGKTGLMPLVWNLNAYGRYPIEIYRGGLRFLLTWVLPLAFVGFIPAASFLRPRDWAPLAALTLPVSLAFFGLGLLGWRAGLRRYRGTGS